MPETATGFDIMADEAREKRDEIIELLKKAYWMEIETVMSYIATRSTPTASARWRFASRWRRTSGGAQSREAVRGADQGALRRGPGVARLQRRADVPAAADEQVDIVPVIKGVIEAEQGAIEFYSRIVEETDGVDPVISPVEC